MLETVGAFVCGATFQMRGSLPISEAARSTVNSFSVEEFIIGARYNLKVHTS